MSKPVSINLLITLTAILVFAQAAPPTTMPPVAKIAALPPAAGQAMASIDPERIRAHVKFLSHDLLEGRGTGQRGGEIAAEYIATQFALEGLKPAGDNGTYMQKVPLVGVTTIAGTTFSLVPAKGDARTLQFLTDYVGYNENQQPVSDVDADIVYVG